MTSTSDDQFNHWLHVEGEWIEPPNHRRGGSSGVIRHQPESGPALYIKRQQGHLFRSWRYPLGRPTCLREARALAHFQELGVLVPVLRFFGLKKERLWQGILVTEALPEGFVSLDDFFSQKRAAATPVQRKAVAEALATILARLHKHRWQHCSLMTKHIFVRIIDSGEHQATTTAQIALIDLERARRQPLATRAARRDLAFLFGHLPYWTKEEWRLFDRHYCLHFGREVLYRVASPA
jgi:tRNA A-37 threonylcarbamoyl transferase component Bud32